MDIRSTALLRSMVGAAGLAAAALSLGCSAVTLDSDPNTLAIDRGAVTAAVGSTFAIGVVVHAPPRPYAGYEYAVTFEPSIVSFVSEKVLKPDGLTLCAAPVRLDNPTLVYAGCLRPEGETSFAGQVAIVTFRCESAGTAQMRTLTHLEGNDFGTGSAQERRTAVRRSGRPGIPGGV